ncbi:MAG: zinc-binding dehydrogenase [Candidatus Rokubacteria bacterium]|nr:zinc-binding dehydrogenase [Candidatus Rokubacteria bacterium]MBI3105255.1 zinc-binding dehydrogenase [Candidatus Rokubacteria bacterium]
MRAIVLRGPGPAELLRVEEIADPEPAAGEVVVRLRAAALNHRDVWIRSGSGAYAGGFSKPVILGSDGAGEVVAAGAGVDPTLVGRAVVINPSLGWGEAEAVQGPAFRILGFPDDGTYAQLVRVPAVNVHAKPASLSFDEAACIPLAGLTAYRAVVSRAGVRAGETVLVTGIGGGVSTFALQIAAHRGARVLVTSGSDAKLARARALGAAGGANYRTRDWGREIVALCGDQGPDVVIDSVGGDTFARAVDILRPGGRIASYGATTGPVKELALRSVFWKQVTVLGTTMGSPREFEAMLALYDRGGLRPAVDRVFPVEEAAAAHRHLEEAAQFGKVVLRI